MFRSSGIDNFQNHHGTRETTMRKRLHQSIGLLAIPLATSFLTDVLEPERSVRPRNGLFRTRISPLQDTSVSLGNDGDAEVSRETIA